jgi:hypothetical protein
VVSDFEALDELSSESEGVDDADRSALLSKLARLNEGAAAVPGVPAALKSCFADFAAEAKAQAAGEKGSGSSFRLAEKRNEVTDLALTACSATDAAAGGIVSGTKALAVALSVGREAVAEAAFDNGPVTQVELDAALRMAPKAKATGRLVGNRVTVTVEIAGKPVPTCVTFEGHVADAVRGACPAG